jgi:hypothetical protein
MKNKLYNLNRKLCNLEEERCNLEGKINILNTEITELSNIIEDIKSNAEQDNKKLKVISNNYRTATLSDGTILQWVQTYSGVSVNRYFIHAECGTIPDDETLRNFKLFHCPFGLHSQLTQYNGCDGKELTAYTD